MLTSHPTGVRGLKYPLVIIRTANTESHPTGVRGLKYLQLWPERGPAARRTPLGCVD